MNFLKFIGVAWSAFWQAYAVIKDLDKKGVAFLSDQWAQIARWHLEMWLANLAKNPNKGWRALIQSEDQAIRAGQIILKSDMLKGIANARSDFERVTAEAMLRTKLKS